MEVKADEAIAGAGYFAGSGHIDGGFCNPPGTFVKEGEWNSYHRYHIDAIQLPVKKEASGFCLLKGSSCAFTW